MVSECPGRAGQPLCPADSAPAAGPGTSGAGVPAHPRHHGQARFHEVAPVVHPLSPVMQVGGGEAGAGRRPVRSRRAGRDSSGDAPDRARTRRGRTAVPPPPCAPVPRRAPAAGVLWPRTVPCGTPARARRCPGQLPGSSGLSSRRSPSAWDGVRSLMVGLLRGVCAGRLVTVFPSSPVLCPLRGRTAARC